MQLNQETVSKTIEQARILVCFIPGTISRKEDTDIAMSHNTISSGLNVRK